MQMFLQYYNNADASIFAGDPVKLGLSVFSIIFDLFFMVQHYAFYPPKVGGGKGEYQPLTGSRSGKLVNS
jgi:hypothetical protein